MGTRHLLLGLALLLAALPLLIHGTAAIANGETFIGFQDQPLYLAQAEFVKHGFVHPFSSREHSLIGDPHLGSTAVHVSLGFISLFTGIPVWILLFAGQVLATFFVFYACWRLYRALDAEHANSAFLLLLLATGIGGIARLVTGSKATIWLHIGSPVTLYYALAIGLGIFALLASMRGRYWLATACLFVSILIHPQVGVLLLGACLLYLLLQRLPFSRFLVIGLSLAAVAVFVAISRDYSDYVSGQDLVTIGLAAKNVIVFLLNYGHLLVFGLLYALHVHLGEGKKPYLTFDFLGAWTLVLVLPAMMPETLLGFFRSLYFSLILWVPLCLVAAKGIALSARRFHVSPRLIVILLILISLPSFYYRYFALPVQSFDQDTSAVFAVLKEQPFGVAWGPEELAHAIPFLGGQRTVTYDLKTYRVPPPDVSQDYLTLTAPDVDVLSKQEIIERYGIDYLVTRASLEQPSFEPLFTRGGWYVYRLGTPNEHDAVVDT